MIGKLGKDVKALKKILIVEDDQLLNRTLAYNLTSDGYEVISVFNFDSAVRKLRENELFAPHGIQTNSAPCGGR